MLLHRFIACHLNISYVPIQAGLYYALLHHSRVCYFLHVIPCTEKYYTVLEDALSKHSATTMNVILSNLKKGVSITHSWVNNMNFHSRRLPGQRHVHSDFEKPNSFFYLPACHPIQNQNY